MQKKYWMMSIVGMSLICMNTFADNSKYQQTHFEIINQTHYDELVRVYNTEGTWKKSLVNDRDFLLTPGQTYKNTLVSNATKSGFESFVSVTVAKKEDPRENYLDFGASTDSSRKEVFSDIFDGLGDMFVSSWDNECKDLMPDGHALCQLIIRDKQ